MNLDLSNLIKAVQHLEAALDWATNPELMSKLEDKQRLTVVSGVIKNFEFTYELSWRIMKRWLEANLSSDEVEGVNRKEFYRICAENKLIDDVNLWFEFHKYRNQTSHIYDEIISQETFQVVISFLAEAKKLIKTLEHK